MINYRECGNHEFRKQAELTSGPVGLDPYLQWKQNNGQNIFFAVPKRFSHA